MLSISNNLTPIETKIYTALVSSMSSLSGHNSLDYQIGSETLRQCLLNINVPDAIIEGVEEGSVSLSSLCTFVDQIFIAKYNDLTTLIKDVNANLTEHLSTIVKSDYLLYQICFHRPSYLLNVFKEMSLKVSQHYIDVKPIPVMLTYFKDQLDNVPELIPHLMILAPYLKISVNTYWMKHFLTPESVVTYEFDLVSLIKLTNDVDTKLKYLESIPHDPNFICGLINTLLDTNLIIKIINTNVISSAYFVKHIEHLSNDVIKVLLNIELSNEAINKFKDHLLATQKFLPGQPVTNFRLLSHKTKQNMLQQIYQVEDDTVLVYVVMIPVLTIGNKKYEISANYRKIIGYNSILNKQYEKGKMIELKYLDYDTANPKANLDKFKGCDIYHAFNDYLMLLGYDSSNGLNTYCIGQFLVNINDLTLDKANNCCWIQKAEFHNVLTIDDIYSLINQQYGLNLFPTDSINNMKNDHDTIYNKIKDQPQYSWPDPETEIIQIQLEKYDETTQLENKIYTKMEFADYLDDQLRKQLNYLSLEIDKTSNFIEYANLLMTHGLFLYQHPAFLTAFVKKLKIFCLVEPVMVKYQEALETQFMEYIEHIDHIEAGNEEKVQQFRNIIFDEDASYQSPSISSFDIEENEDGILVPMKITGMNDFNDENYENNETNDEKWEVAIDAPIDEGWIQKLIQLTNTIKSQLIIMEKVKYAEIMCYKFLMNPNLIPDYKFIIMMAMPLVEEVTQLKPEIKVALTLLKKDIYIENIVETSTEDNVEDVVLVSS